MITLSNINDLEKILRAHLISQSEVEGRFVRNSLSLRGETLEKQLSEQKYASIDNTDVMILFELQSRENESDVSETEQNDTISYYKSFKLYVIIYGDNSTNVANNIVARFRTQRVRLSLQSNGVYLERVSNPVKIDEYINETMWIRNDIEFDISCHLKITQVSEDTSFQSINDILIKNI